MTLKESGEMYLETILVLGESMGHVRSIDIAEYMNFSKPSISRAMGKLKENGYIEIDKNGYITLLPAGDEIARKIYERHQVLTKILVSLGVDEETASQDACKMEHVLSDKTFAAIKNHINQA